MFDALNCFTLQSDGTLAQTETSDSASENIIDLDVAGISAVNPSVGPFLIVRCITLYAGSLASLEIFLETDSASGFSTNKKQIQLWRFTEAQLASGALLINQQLPIWDLQRYIRLYFKTWTDTTTGSLFACLADGPETPQTDKDLVQANS